MMDIANRKPTRLAVDLLAPRDGEHILDAGCGTGSAMTAVLRRASCRMTGIDISRTMLAAAANRLGSKATLRRGQIADPLFADGTFDAVLALNVLYFCDPAGQMILNLHRVLKPGGRLVAYVTHRDTMNGWRFAQQGIHRLFDEDELAKLLTTGGFAREKIAIHTMPIARRVKGLLAYAER